jgi:nucleoside-diphosphate-sugar epimerase
LLLHCTLSSSCCGSGGTRFIGLYLARQLVEAGHEVTLYTRGKKAITSKIADDSEWGYQKFASSVKHIAGDRQVRQHVITLTRVVTLHATSCRTLLCANETDLLQR